MKPRCYRVAFLIFCFCLSLNLWSQSPALNSPQVEKRIDQLLKQMTLEEKIGQLNQYSQGAATGPGTGRSGYPEMVSKGEIGSIFNLTGAKETNQMQRIAMEKSRLHIPLIFGLDVVHGYRTTFPVPLALSATWDPALIERAARIAAKEASTDGVRWTFSPMVDIARDARWGRITEGAGEDPYLGSEIAKAYVRGYQGSLDSPDSIAACMKHFVGYGAAEGGRDYNTTEISDRTLREYYLRPFKAGADAGALTFMSAFNSLNEVPASANLFTLRQILRKEWGYKGMVVSDWQSLLELKNHGIANDDRTAAAKSILAGVDMDMEGNIYHTEMLDLVKSGVVPVSVIDESVRNVLRVKIALGLFEHPYADDTKSAFDGPIPAAYRQEARKAAEESFILLKNDNAGGHAVLPLTDVHKIAVVGPMADDAEDMLGAWGAKGNAKDVVTLKSALTEYASAHNIAVTFADDANSIPADADVVLVAVGENASLMTGEAGSRTHLDLPGHEIAEAAAKSGKPVVLLAFNGRPIVLTDVAPKMNAILEAWFPGVEAGPALVETLFGVANPSGRVTASFPRSVGQEPLYYNALSTGRPATGVDLTHPPTKSEEKYHTRYIDEQNAPLYPFGYGLSYSSFEYSAPKLSAASASAKAINAGDANAAIKVSAMVKNTSNRPGDEIVQFYIRQRGTSVARPVRELKGFQKVTLAAGETKNVEFTLSRKELAFWNIDMKEVVEPAELSVWIAGDSVSGTPAKIEIKP
ncbi:glycoside hydrolase, family 3-like protein [Candidatus Koribacter versatilis Ellin345]|uniref:beta-glucosidase n=1 Tax=Koribacter versatilis (strain Ellin345) TaxID=204669 RepID=Q1IUB5_KORVE|nr:glycoside hydrolase family 3 N-terminal domain-containing protein [Candidatus Koribacter versatilis]ABF39535.1 glycoside hydrolase, family 3-like protein [Candidatus Koribacter versatilis Ellin345]